MTECSGEARWVQSGSPEDMLWGCESERVLGFTFLNLSLEKALGGSYVPG